MFQLHITESLFFKLNLDFMDLLGVSDMVLNFWSAYEQPISV